MSMDFYPLIYTSAHREEQRTLSEYNAFVFVNCFSIYIYPDVDINETEEKPCILRLSLVYIKKIIMPVSITGYRIFEIFA